MIKTTKSWIKDNIAVRTVGRSGTRGVVEIKAEQPTNESIFMNKQSIQIKRVKNNRYIYIFNDILTEELGENLKV